jgi:predicted dehydrogenase
MAEIKQRLRIAMVGSGFIAGAHSNAFHQVTRFFSLPCELKTKVVCGRTPERLAAMAAQWGWEETALDWEAVVVRKDIEIVDIAVPNGLHAPVAMAAAQAGKIVLCEKPLALSVGEAEAMAKAVRDRPNLVWFNYRRAPAVVFARQLIEQGRIGQVFHYRGQYFNQSGVDPSKSNTWRYRHDEAGSGALGDLLSHSLDTAAYLNGHIAELSATTQVFVPGRDVDDAAMVMARFLNGSLGLLEASRFAVGHRNGNRFEIYGSKGSLAFELERMNWLRFYDAAESPATLGWRNLLVTGPDHPYATNFWKPGHPIGYEHTFIATLGDFLKALAKGERFRPDFDDALETQKLMEAIQSSAASRTWVRL